jgi:hypothetical protein
MSTKRNSKRKDKNNDSKLLLRKQQISQASLGGVNGGGQASQYISGALSAIGSASSSFLETPSGAVSGAASYVSSAYDSDHLESAIKKEAGKAVKGAEHAVGGANNWLHKHLHVSF